MTPSRVSPIALSCSILGLLLLSLITTSGGVRAQVPRLEQGGRAPAPEPVSASEPRVSADGRRIVFVQTTGKANDLCTVDADGTNVRRVPNTESARMPAWSPDGSQVAFVRRDAAGLQKLLVINVDGTGAREVVTGYQKHLVPAYSPNGRRFVLTMDGPNDFGIFTMDVGGSARNNLGRGMQPAWSPDGKSIAFAQSVEGVGVRIFVMNSEGLGRRQVSTGPGAHEYPAWSPDGRRIAFQASLPKVNGRSGAEIRMIDVDGTSEVAIGSHSGYVDETPSWFPDGKRLVIASDRSGAMRLYEMDLAGKELRRYPLAAP